MWALPRGRTNGRTNKCTVSGKKQRNENHTFPITRSRLSANKCDLITVVSAKDSRSKSNVIQLHSIFTNPVTFSENINYEQ